MKKCIVISDSFKGSLPSRDICAIARERIPLFFPACEVRALNVADGGEGTVDCFLDSCGGERVLVSGVQNPYGEPIDAAYGLLPQVELLGKTFGIYGYGSIGRQTARIAKAFGMEVLVCTRTVRPAYAADGVEFVDFDTLLARSDVLSLHCPATPETRGLMSREALAKMKPGAILLNTARGALVDEEAVADALESGKLAFYGADAFATEPLPPQSRLRSLPGAVLTPHIAWTTKEALQRLMDITTGNLRSFLAGKGENLVNS